MSNNYNVIISEKAASMLVNHVRFLARVSEIAAAKLHKEIIEEAKFLKQMPEANPYFNCPEIPANKYRKKLVAKRYLLIYQIKENDVFVDYILDCRQEYKWLLK